MMKKLAVLLSVLLMFPVCAMAVIPARILAVPEYVAIDSSFGCMMCEHEYRWFAVSNAGWYSVNETAATHEYRVYDVHYCDFCGDELVTFKASQQEEHLMILVQNQHMDGENLHEYLYCCSKCEHRESIRFGCGGTGHDDCLIILPDEILVQPE